MIYNKHLRRGFFDPRPAVEREPNNKDCNWERFSETNSVWSGLLQDKMDANNLYDFF
jgi:hypothetical protein